MPQLQSIRNLLKKQLTFLCVNDLMDHEEPDVVMAKKALDEFYLELYPEKSSFEL